jgi:hypothetical protein
LLYIKRGAPMSSVSIIDLRANMLTRQFKSSPAQHEELL